jgi:hypothetical protein
MQQRAQERSSCSPPVRWSTVSLKRWPRCPPDQTAVLRACGIGAGDLIGALGADELDPSFSPALRADGWEYASSASTASGQADQVRPRQPPSGAVRSRRAAGGSVRASGCEATARRDPAPGSANVWARSLLRDESQGRGCGVVCHHPVDRRSAVASVLGAVGGINVRAQRGLACADVLNGDIDLEPGARIRARRESST